MFCPVCQKPNEDTAVYCAYCGAAMSAPPVSRPTYTSPAPQPTYATSTPQPECEPPVYQPGPPSVAPLALENPVIAAVKETAASPAFLTAAIAFTLSIVLSFASAFTLTNSISHFMEQIISMAQGFTAEDGMYSDWETDENFTDDYFADDFLDDFEEEGYGELPPIDNESFSEFMGMFDALMTGSMVSSMVPSLVMNGLMAAALWMLFAAGKDRNRLGMSTTGLTILKVMTILGLVGICVAAFLCLLVMGILMLAVNVASQELGDAAAVVSVVFGVLLVVLAAIFAFAIVYQAKVLQSINTVKKTLTTGVPSDKVSMFVAVMCFISGGLNGMSALSLVVLGDFFVLLSTLAGAAASIAFGVVIVQYRNRMQGFVPVGGMPPVPPAAPYVQAQYYYGVPAPGQEVTPAPASVGATSAPVDEIPAETDGE